MSVSVSGSEMSISDLLGSLGKSVGIESCE